MSKGHVRSIKLAVESASGFEVPADHDLLTPLVPYATSMHRRFSVGRDGKTAHERSVERRAVPPVAQVGERVWWMASAAIQPSSGPFWIHDFEQGRYMGPMDGSNTVLTIKRHCHQCERWKFSSFDKAPRASTLHQMRVRKTMAVALGAELLCCISHCSMWVEPTSSA